MKNISAKKLIPCICGMCLALILIAVSCLVLGHGRPEKEGHHVVIFGDSIIAYAQDETSVANMLVRETGMDVFDLSFGGTQMALSSDAETLGNKRNYLSMYSIAQSLYADDFTIQEHFFSQDVASEYFEGRVAQLKTLDLKNSDIVIIEHLLNDYHSSVPITSDDGSEYTYTGALAAVVSYIRSVNPDIRIIILSPTKKWLLNGPEAGEIDNGGGTLNTYLAAQEKAAENLGVEYLDITGIYDEEYVTPEGEVITGYGYTVDGTHPNYYGRMAISRRLAEYLGES